MVEYYFTAQIYHILFIHSSLDGHLSYFTFWHLSFVCELFFEHQFTVLGGLHPGVEFLGPIVGLYLTHRGVAQLLSHNSCALYPLN